MQVELSQHNIKAGVALCLTAQPDTAAERNAAAFHLTPHRRATTVSVANWLRWVDCDRRGEHGRCQDLQAPAVLLHGNSWVWHDSTTRTPDAPFIWQAVVPLTPVTSACIERLCGSISFDLLDTTLQQLTAELHLALSADAVLPAAAVALSAGKSPAVESDGWRSPVLLPAAAADPAH